MKVFCLVHQEARRRAEEAVRTAGDGWRVRLLPPSRTLDQNAAMWPILEAFARQAKWPVNGVMTTLTAEDWKDILTAAFSLEQHRVAQGLNGGMVLLGQRTSKMGKARFSEFLEFLHATAIERGVVVYADEKSQASDAA